MRLRPTCTPGSSGCPPKPQALDESDLRIDGVGRNAPGRQGTGVPPAVDTRANRDGVPRKRNVSERYERFRGERPDRGTTSQNAPTAEEVAARPASRGARALGSVSARRRAEVHGDGLGCGRGPPTQGTKAKSEIEIGAVEGKALVEAARLIPRRTPIRVGATAGRDEGRPIG